MRGKNSPYKRGIVTENDPKTGRSKVQFKDEDGVSSYWLHWNMPMAGGSKIYMQPDVGSQVNCLVDHHGEQGTILGSTYSEQDPPPTQDGNKIVALLGALQAEIDKAGGKLNLTSDVAFKGNIDFSGGYVKHNGHDIGDTHQHTDVQPGAALSGKPK